MAGARIVEVFSSLQGEGLRLGERQIFVRFGGCNLRCDYCDEPRSLRSFPGASWSAARLKARILALQRTRRHRSVSWTGGEPLLWAKFLLEMMAWARKKGFENHLETNGLLPAQLRLVAGLADAVAMDFKLPSATGRRTWKAHAACVRVAPQKTFVKVVLTTASRTAEFRKVLKILEDLPDVPLILQPATPDRAGKVRPIEPERVMALFGLARSMRKGVRLTPQWHPIWGVR